MAGRLYNFNQARDEAELKRMLESVFERLGLWDLEPSGKGDLVVQALESPGAAVVRGMLVHQSGGVAIPADQTNTGHWAIGVCLRAGHGKIFHAPVAHLIEMPVAGTVTDGRWLYLGEKGAATFDEPTGGSNTILRQHVGRAIRPIRGNLYEVVVNITPESLV